MTQYYQNYAAARLTGGRISEATGLVGGLGSQARLPRATHGLVTHNESLD